MNRVKSNTRWLAGFDKSSSQVTIANANDAMTNKLAMTPASGRLSLLPKTKFTKNPAKGNNIIVKTTVLFNLSP